MYNFIKAQITLGNKKNVLKFVFIANFYNDVIRDRE